MYIKPASELTMTANSYRLDDHGLHAYIFKSSQSHSVGKDCSVSNSPLRVAWLVVIADSNLSHSRNGYTLKDVPCPRHTIPNALNIQCLSRDGSRTFRMVGL
jgi:hypothetical protein